MSSSRHVRDELPAAPGYLLKKCSRLKRAVGRRVGLELAVHRLEEALVAATGVVSRAKSGSQSRAPEQLDHVPAGAGEQPLQLLDDRAVAAHRAVEALQVAVDDEDQVVEPSRAASERPGERLGLVHLAVADERPDLAAAPSRRMPRCSR